MDSKTTNALAGECAIARRTITNAERALGKLTRGQRSDLIMDNHDWVLDSDHAHSIVDRIAKEDAEVKS